MGNHNSNTTNAHTNNNLQANLAVEGTLRHVCLQPKPQMQKQTAQADVIPKPYPAYVDPQVLEEGKMPHEDPASGAALERAQGGMVGTYSMVPTQPPPPPMQPMQQPMQQQMQQQQQPSAVYKPNELGAPPSIFLVSEETRDIFRQEQAANRGWNNGYNIALAFLVVAVFQIRTLEDHTNPGRLLSAFVALMFTIGFFIMQVHINTTEDYYCTLLSRVRVATPEERQHFIEGAVAAYSSEVVVKNKRAYLNAKHHEFCTICGDNGEFDLYHMFNILLYFLIAYQIILLGLALACFRDGHCWI